MIYLIVYYFIGVFVSIFFIYYYRLSNTTKSKPKKFDGIGGIIGPWLFPLQIVLHFFTRNNYKKTSNDNA